MDGSTVAAWSGYTASVEAAFAGGHVTRTWRDALQALARLAGPFGCFPSQARIAREAKASPATVKRALRWARSESLLGWTKARVATEDGRTRFSTCTYAPVAPAPELAALPQPHRPFRAWMERYGVLQQISRALRPAPPSVAQSEPGLFTVRDSSLTELWKKPAHPPLRSVAEQIAAALGSSPASPPAPRDQKEAREAALRAARTAASNR